MLFPTKMTYLNQSHWNYQIMVAMWGLSAEIHHGTQNIARLHFRGQLKRSLYLATCSLDAQPVIADQLYISDHENSVGVIINVHAFEDKYYLLAVIEKELVEHQLALRETNGARLTLQPLPY